MSAAIAAAVSATIRGNIRTALQDSAFDYAIHPNETASGLVDANLKFGYPYGNVFRYGVVGDGVTDDQPALQAALGLTAVLNITVPEATYKISTLVLIAATGNNRTITFRPGAVINSSQPATTALGLFQFSATGDHFTIAGNGVRMGYTTAPTVRINHGIYVTGAAITNLDISGIDIYNGGNMGIAVFCGNTGTVAAGSQRINIHDCKISNTLGDGVHVENADSSVRITNIQTINCADDCTAVLNYTGASGAATHPTPTIGVIIDNIQNINNVTSSVSLAGVQGCAVSNIQETCAAGSSVLTLKLTHAAGYTVGNSACVFENIVTNGTTKVIGLDTPGAVTAANGTQYQKNMRFRNIVASGVKNQCFSLSNFGTAAGGQIQDIEMDGLDLTGDGSAASQVGYIANTLNCRIGSLRGDTFNNGLQIAANNDFSWGYIKLQSFVAATTFGISATTNNNIRCGALEMNAGNCTTGLQFQSNAGVTHDGLWAVANATTNYAFGSNSLVKGFFDQIGEYKAIGTVTAASTTALVYPRAVPAGAATIPLFTRASDLGLRWGVKNVTGTGATLLWTDADTTVYLQYNIGIQAA